MTSYGAEHPARELLAQLRTQFPDSPFLALGQTVFWDEPVKAVLRQLLDSLELGGVMVLGIHDTDYFAKTRAGASRQGRFLMLPHNDGTTRDLWSAAGEISTLFGSETFPRRSDFVRAGGAFDRVAGTAPEGRQVFCDSLTEAWGWRALVYTGSRDLIMNRLSLREVGDGILEMLGWGFENALLQIAPECCQTEARRTTDTILHWCHIYRAAHPDHTLTDLYQYLLPKLHSLLLKHPPAQMTVTCTTDLLLLTPQTACLPRFRFVDLFLNPATRETAIAAYNAAVAGSEIYTLDRFGAGALPFDVVLPDRGRGTLRITPRVLFVETRQPLAIGLKRPIESLQEVAEILTARYGEQVTLVGKAVSLISMLAQEYIFVFHEEGSQYVHRTRRMNDLLARQGVPLDMRPILRLRYSTWDSLEASRATLCLPPHLASAFGRSQITGPEFASQWRHVVEEQRRLCREMARLRRPTDLIRSLQERDPMTPWAEHLEDYAAARAALVKLRAQAVSLHEEIHRLYTQLKELRRRSVEIQQAQGAHFRSVAAWTPDQMARRQEFDTAFQTVEEEKHSLCRQAALLSARRRAIERGPEAAAARAVLQRIEISAEHARLGLIRNALLTAEGLPHTDHRPSAWWLPLLDATGDLFRRIVETTVSYTEPLLSL